MNAGGIICVTGRPAAGKSTLASTVVQGLLNAGLRAALLDGDELRGALVPALGYTAGERDAFYAALANVAGLLARQGLWVVVPATHHLQRYRRELAARSPRFLEVFVDATAAECEARDLKGLYARFRAGDAPDLPGVGAPYEAPQSPDVVAAGGRDVAAAARVVALAVEKDRELR